MSRYIDVDDLISKMNIFLKEKPHILYWKNEHVLYLLEREAQRHSVCIVRCKDCKYWATEHCYMNWILKEPKPEDFCSQGERKE